MDRADSADSLQTEPVHRRQKKEKNNCKVEVLSSEPSNMGLHSSSAGNVCVHVVL